MGYHSTSLTDFMEGLLRQKDWEQLSLATLQRVCTERGIEHDGKTKSQLAVLIIAQQEEVQETCRKKRRVSSEDATVKPPSPPPTQRNAAPNFYITHLSHG